MKVLNKIFVVTGGGNGIGRELVLNLLGKGAIVAAVDISESALQETVELAGSKRENLSTHIVNVSSMGGFLPVPGQSVYGASKAAVKLLTEGLHSELLNTNVRVTVVFPGAIGTNIAANSGVGIGLEVENSENGRSFNPLAPSKAAAIIVDGIENNSYRVLVGSDAKMMDFLSRLSPKRAANFIFKQMQALLPT